VVATAAEELLDRLLRAEIGIYSDDVRPYAVPAGATGIE